MLDQTSDFYSLVEINTVLANLCVSRKTKHNFCDEESKLES